MEKRRRIGAYGIARDERGHVLLVRSSERSNHPGQWSLPGGGLDHGEDPNTGVVREFLEETGLLIEPTRLIEVNSDLVEFPWRGVLLHHDRILFEVKIVGGALLAEADGTTDKPEWVAPHDISSLNLVTFTARALGLSDVDAEVNRTPAVPDEHGEVAATGHSLADVKQVTRFGAYGVVTDPVGRVLLSLIANGYPGGGNWHLPGGGTDFGEQPADGLLREIFEETAQVGRVTELIRVGARHNRAALGPEGEPLDWYTVRAIFKVTVDNPTPAQVTEAAGGSTAASAWYSADELSGLPLSDLARRELLHIDLD